MESPSTKCGSEYNRGLEGRATEVHQMGSVHGHSSASQFFPWCDTFVLYNRAITLKRIIGKEFARLPYYQGSGDKVPQAGSLRKAVLEKLCCLSCRGCPSESETRVLPDPCSL